MTNLNYSEVFFRDEMCLRLLQNCQMNLNSIQFRSHFQTKIVTFYSSIFSFGNQFAIFGYSKPTRDHLCALILFKASRSGVIRYSLAFGCQIQLKFLHLAHYPDSKTKFGGNLQHLPQRAALFRSWSEINTSFAFKKLTHDFCQLDSGEFWHALGLFLKQRRQSR